MSKPALKLMMWSALLLVGASCAQQPATGGDTATAIPDARDFSGIWQYFTADLTQFLLPGEEISLTEVGAERYLAVDHGNFLGNSCQPYGPNRAMAASNPYMIVQTPEIIALIMEHIDYRTFYMDGTHPDDILDYPEWMGHSIGRWEGDTLVVDTIGMRPETWLDRGGLMHSEQLHLVERFDKTGPDTFDWTVTVEDPVFFTKPWTYRLPMARVDFPRLLPARCADNEVDAEHMQSLPGADHENPPTLPEGFGD